MILCLIVNHIIRPVQFQLVLTYASLFAPTYPPNPIEMAPAVNSANPPRTTTLVLPNADKPALSAKGTVNPSDKPRIASDMMRGLIRDRELQLELLVVTESSSEGGMWCWNVW